MQQHAQGALENIHEGMRPMREVEQAIVAGLTPKEIRDITDGGSISMMSITGLAIDALGNGDPQFLLDLYKNGGNISLPVLLDLGTALVWAARRNKDSLDMFNDLKAKHGY